MDTADRERGCAVMLRAGALPLCAGLASRCIGDCGGMWCRTEDNNAPKETSRGGRRRRDDDDDDGGYGRMSEGWGTIHMIVGMGGRRGDQCPALVRDIPCSDAAPRSRSAHCLALVHVLTMRLPPHVKAHTQSRPKAARGAAFFTVDRSSLHWKFIDTECATGRC